MIQKAVAQFAALPDCESIHLRFFFTSDFQKARKASIGKLLELLRVIGRLLRIRLRGPIDLLLYPTGGPQTVPIVRDILLLPWMLLLSRRVMLHFHAAGVADRFAAEPKSLLCVLLRAAYRRVFGAVVMADFNRRDPELFGITNVLVRPHCIRDESDAALLVGKRKSQDKRLLYVGHLHPDKGTDALLRAFAEIRAQHPDATLELVGECLPPWTEAELGALLGNLGLAGGVTLSGVLTGRRKAEAYARANLFVFPTVAPYESFGLVLVEAMMWSLPIVASEWRGNQDVLTPAYGGVTFPVREPLAEQIRRAFDQALAQRSRWEEWGEANRALFQDRYQEKDGELWLAQPIVAQLSGS